MIRGSAANAPLADVLESWERVAVRWKLDRSERSLLIGGICRDPAEPMDDYRLLCGQQRIRLLVEADGLFQRVIGQDDAVREWLRRPNENLGGRTPISVMAATPEWLRWLMDNTGSRK